MTRFNFGVIDFAFIRGLSKRAADVRSPAARNSFTRASVRAGKLGLRATKETVLPFAVPERELDRPTLAMNFLLTGSRPPPNLTAPPVPEIAFVGINSSNQAIISDLKLLPNSSIYRTLMFFPSK